MTADIVERLRTHFKGVDDKGLGSSTFDLVQEAADEIERLRAELDAYKAKGAAHIRILAVNNDELRAEIEKLRAAHAFAIKVHDVKMKGSPARWSEPPEV